MDDHLCEAFQSHITIGQAHCEVQHRHWRQLLVWNHQQFSLGLTPTELYQRLVP